MELVYAVIPGIRYKYVLLLINGNPVRIRELPLLTYNLCAPLKEWFARSGQLLNAVIPSIGNIDTAAPVKSDSTWIAKLTRFSALFAPLFTRLAFG